MKVWLGLIILFFSWNLFASSYVGTITRTSGEVKILTKARSKPKGKGPWVKFDGRYYKVKKARVGYKLKNENVVQSYSNGKAMVIFPNGDQINVGPGTSYEMAWNQKEKKTNTVLKMLYGNVRGVVSPKGPRKNMRIITKTAVAGVRGTDFSISAVGSETEVSVLRGKVEVKPIAKKAKPIAIESGFTAKVKVEEPKVETPKAGQATSKKTEKVVEAKPETILKKITKEKLVEIQNISTVKTKPLETTSLAEAESITKELKKLEAAAKETVLEDIKTYNPEEFKKLEAKKENIDVTEINTTVVSKLFKEAPSEPEKAKFSEDDFEDLDDDIYNKYFKN
jgi:hypothetical protein